MVCRKNDVLGSIVLKNVQILRFVRREPPHRLRGAGIGAIIKYGYLSAKGARGVSSNLYELLALAMRYVFAALMVLIVLRAARITAVDSRRARRLRRLSPQTGIVGEMLVMDGGERARPGMRYPVTLEGAIGSSRRADIRLRHSSVRARHAFYQMTDDGLFVRSHAGARIFDDLGRGVKEIVLADGDCVMIGRVKLMLVLSGADAESVVRRAHRRHECPAESAEPEFDDKIFETRAQDPDDLFLSNPASRISADMDEETEEDEDDPYDTGY